MEKVTSGSFDRVFVKHLGIGYLLIVLIGLVNSFIIKNGVYELDTFVETAHFFRLAQAVDLVMFCIVIWVSWSSYLIVKSINPSLSLLGLLFRFGEGLLGCVAAMISLMVALILAESRWTAFDAKQLEVLAVMFMDLNNMAWNILFVLMGVGATIFMYLFYISNYVPRWLSVWGLFSYSSMAVYGLVNVAVAGVPDQFMLIMFPGMFFELTFGAWLMLKGIDISRQARQT